MKPATMDGRRRLASATALVMLALQLAMATVGTAGLCMVRPHAHEGGQDCPMHHSAPAAPTGGRHQHHTGAHQETTSIQSGCRCSTDTPVFLMADIGLVPEQVAARMSVSGDLVLTTLVVTTLDLRIPPLAPPPRRSIS